ncbi:Conserved oligomeric Golgi complex subunit 8 [Coccomyxa sp. Obi]|nr:Conserved oligomeric Golgi complex subunit 8 [Coccomyxa sp. Obi]
MSTTHSYATGAEREQAEAYFSDLLSYSLERLSKEPELLRADQDQLRRQAQEATKTHYRAFIAAAEGLETTLAELEGVSCHLDALAADLPALSSACDTFTQSAAQFAAKRSENKQLLKQHPVLLELLEVPQLMDACVRNGNYDDALDLRAFVAKMALLHADLKIVQQLVAEVEAASEAMLAGLMAKLRGPIQLPECLRIVGCLRRLAPFPEPELRRRFLQCREEWLAELVRELDDTNVYEYVKRLTDVHRLQLFDVVMQFRAIFSDDSSPQETVGGTSSGTSTESRDGGAVYSWAQHRLVFYLETLAGVLPRIGEGGSLASVLEHCMYCGMSLGRVGLDFRGLLVPLFEAQVLRLYANSVKAATDMFVMLLDVHKWVAMPAVAARVRQAGSTADPSTPKGEDSAGPPYALLEHAPLAVLTNGLLAAFNELRHCAPLSLCSSVAAILQEALEGAVRVMAHYRATRALEDTNSVHFEAACTAMTGSVVPYIAACFGRIYPGQGKLIDVRRATAALNAPPPVVEEGTPQPASSDTSALTSA